MKFILKVMSAIKALRACKQRLYTEFSCMHENRTKETLRKNNFLGEVMSNERSKFEMGEILKSVRESKGYTQEELASRAGINRNTLRSFENGVGAYNCHVLFRITYALELDPYEVMFN